MNQVIPQDNPLYSRAVEIQQFRAAARTKLANLAGHADKAALACQSLLGLCSVMEEVPTELIESITLCLPPSFFPFARLTHIIVTAVLKTMLPLFMAHRR